MQPAFAVVPAVLPPALVVGGSRASGHSAELAARLGHPSALMSYYMYIIVTYYHSNNGIIITYCYSSYCILLSLLLHRHCLLLLFHYYLLSL